MKTILVIPDYKYGTNGWEAERSYFKGFSICAEANGWKVVNIRDSISIDEIDCIFVPNYATYFDRIHNSRIHEKIITLKIPKILAIFEAPSRRPDLWNSTRWFDVCISFNKKPKKYCHCEHVENPYPYNFSENEFIFKDWNSRNTLIWAAANNWYSGFDSLSQHRLRDYSYFADKLDGKVAIYGKGWDMKYGSLHGPIPILGKLQSKKNMNIYNNLQKYWFGTTENKSKEISNYKFCFSYENTDNFPGYVTEKVFDAWMSGCIPIYRGEKEFEKKYKDMLIAPRILGISKSVEVMQQFNQEAAHRVFSTFHSMMKDGKFKDFSHEIFQKKIFDVATSLV